MRRERFGKIVATLGPASSAPEVMEALFLAGVDVFRLNFSHGSHDQHLANIKAIRQLEEKHQHPIAILQDLQGPKFRVGRFKGDLIKLTPKQEFTFDLNEDLGDETRVYLPHPEIFASAAVGNRLLIDDARVSFEIIEVGADKIRAKLVYGKTLSNNKGVNLPDTVLNVSVMTEKDHKDLQFGLAHGVDYVALSFVQKAADMQQLKSLVKGRAAVLAKIEKPSAVQDIDNILEESDAIMLARGDLGVEFPPEELPSIQKSVVQSARHAGRPIIIATQMLESMIESPVPTRAEAMDVDTAISEGADAVMLSGETASGKYPVETVTFMDKMICQTEKDAGYRQFMRNVDSGAAHSSEGSIALAVKAIVKTSDIAGVVCYTTSGRSAIRMGRERALTPLLALTPSIEVARRLQLSWGVDASVMPDVDRLQKIVAAATTVMKSKGYGKDGDMVVVTAGVPFGQSGTTNTLRLAIIGEDDSEKIIA